MLRSGPAKPPKAINGKKAKLAKEHFSSRGRTHRKYLSEGEILKNVLLTKQASILIPMLSAAAENYS